MHYKNRVWNQIKSILNNGLKKQSSAWAVQVASQSIEATLANTVRKTWHGTSELADLFAVSAPIFVGRIALPQEFGSAPSLSALHVG